MTILEAIFEVMRESGQSMTPKEVYRSICDRELYTFKAIDPLGVVSGQIRRHCLGLDFPSAENIKFFQLENDGTFSLLIKPQRIGPPGRNHTGRVRKQKQKPIYTKGTLASKFEEIRKLQSEYRELLKDLILRDLMRLSPVEFEHFSKRLLEVYGFQEVKVTSVTNDGGIDGHGKLRVGLALMGVAFQCKRWTTTNIGRPEIDRFRGAIQGQFEQGIFFTTAGFVGGAQEASIRAGAVPIILVDGSLLVELMIEKGFGVETESLPLHTYALDTILSEGG